MLKSDICTRRPTMLVRQLMPHETPQDRLQPTPREHVEQGDGRPASPPQGPPGDRSTEGTVRGRPQGSQQVRDGHPDGRTDGRSPVCRIRGERRGHSHRRTSGPSTREQAPPVASEEALSITRPGPGPDTPCANGRRQGHTVPKSLPLAPHGADGLALPLPPGPRPFAPPDKGADDALPGREAGWRGRRPAKAVVASCTRRPWDKLTCGTSRLGPAPGGSLRGKHKGRWRPHGQLAKRRPSRRPSRGESGAEKPGT